MTVGLMRSGNSTGIGTGTTKTLISPTSGLFMPSDAKVLLAVKTSMGEITPTAAETVNARLDIESSDVRNMSPFEVLFAPIGAGLGTFPCVFSGQETYEVNARLSGGESLNMYATALVANAVAPECQAWAIVSNDVRDLMGKVQLHAKLGTFTSSGTTADTDVAGTKYSFSGGRQIVELFGYYHPKVIAAGGMIIGEIKYTSSEFVDSIPQTLPLYPVSSALGTASMSYLIPGISRQKVRIPLKPGQVNVQDYLNFGGVIGSAGSFIDGVIYE